MPFTYDKKPIEFLEYSEWVTSKKFHDSTEHRKFITRETERFLQNHVYSAFYNPHLATFKRSIPFPLVVKDDSRYPKFIVDNDLFTTVFYTAQSRNHGRGWVVSFHIKEHHFCDSRIRDFRKWLKKKYPNILTREMKFEYMPKKFCYPKLQRGSVKKNSYEQDFCIELFSDEKCDELLLKFFECMKLYRSFNEE